nr:hypothetical protein [Tanacetum cinerariifolium]
GVQVPKDDLDNLQAKSKEGTLELKDPQELLGSILLDTFLDLGFLEYTNVTTGLSVLLTIGMGSLGGTIVGVMKWLLSLQHSPYSNDLLALETKFAPVEENTGVLESKFVEGGVVTVVLSNLVTCAVYLIEDLEVLGSIVKAIFKKTEPVDDMDNILLHYLKTMFEHHIKDNVWKSQQILTKVKN